MVGGPEHARRLHRAMTYRAARPCEGMTTARLVQVASRRIAPGVSARPRLAQTRPLGRVKARTGLASRTGHSLIGLERHPASRRSDRRAVRPSLTVLCHIETLC